MAQIEKEIDADIVAIWLRKDPKRWVAGILAGLFAYGMMLAFTMICSVKAGMEVLYPLKLAAVPILGAVATDTGTGLNVLIVGVLFQGGLSALLGGVYAHFTGTNRLAPLFGMGFTWGCFSWIFINNLFLKSFREFYWQSVPAGIAFFAWLVFGFSLMSVSFFDKMLGGSQAARS